MSEQDGDADDTDTAPSGESRQERDETAAAETGEEPTAGREGEDTGGEPSGDDAGGEPGGDDAGATEAEDAEGESGGVADATENSAEDPTESPPGIALVMLDPDAGEPETDLEALRAEVDTDELTVDDRLLAAVRDASAERLGLTLAVLETAVEQLEDSLAAERERAEDLEAQTADLESRLARKQADFQNYKQRQQERLDEEKARATEDLVTRLLDVRDNLQRALDQDESVDIRDGVASTLEQFDRELDREAVERIEPAAGDGVDPRRHEALVTVPATQPEGTVAEVHRPGYEMAGKVLRPAQVAVSDGSGAGGDDAEGDNGAGDDGDATDTNGEPTAAGADGEADSPEPTE